MRKTSPISSDQGLKEDFGTNTEPDSSCCQFLLQPGDSEHEAAEAMDMGNVENTILSKVVDPDKTFRECERDGFRF